MKELPVKLPGTAPDVVLTPPPGRVLLHSCCAPCSSAVLECMLRNGIDTAVYFSNSNITPLEEYEHRKAEMIRWCETLGVEYIEDEYDHCEWLENVGKGREHLPECGPRCLECFRYRLSRAARYAAENGFSSLTTTLASSRWKRLDQVDEAGRDACARAGIQWWEMNWRKGGLQPRRNELIKELEFYDQTFCGCEFAIPGK